MDTYEGRRTTAIIISPAFRVFAAFAFILGFGLDTVTTAWLVSTPGFTELNPLANLALSAGGGVGLAVLKLAVTGGMGLVVYREHDGASLTWWVNVMFATFGSLWFLAGAWNLSLLL